mmetsp:Transcript_15193/g.48369  ORF Transcript_15193/g.48369 Transcript_15193/m.48369 type:complete len:213 (+) Transcript_15193:491-1129(+)
MTSSSARAAPPSWRQTVCSSTRTIPTTPLTSSRRPKSGSRRRTPSLSSAPRFRCRSRPSRLLLRPVAPPPPRCSTSTSLTTCQRSRLAESTSSPSSARARRLLSSSPIRLAWRPRRCHRRPNWILCHSHLGQPFLTTRPDGTAMWRKLLPRPARPPRSFPSPGPPQKAIPPRLLPKRLEALRRWCRLGMKSVALGARIASRCMLLALLQSAS